MKLALANLVLLVALGVIECKVQWLTVRGRARCGLGEAPEIAAPIFIKLIDKDTSGPDDEMDETYASKDSGAFQLRGSASDPLGGAIDPELHLYHRCKGSDRRVKLIIPAEAIDKEYNYTEIINLQGNFPNEEEYKYPVAKCSSVKKPKRHRYFFL